MARKKTRTTVTQPQPAAVAAAKNIPAGGGQLFTYLLAAVALVLPLLMSSSLMDPALVNRHIFLVVYTAIFLLLFLWYKKKQFRFTALTRFVFVVGSIYAVWNVIVTMNAVNPVEGIFETGRVFFSLLLLGAVMITAWLHQPSLNLIARVFTIIGLFHSMVGFLQFFDLGFMELAAGVKSVPYGFMANRNLYGSFMVLCVPFILVAYTGSRGAWKIIAGASLTVTLAAVFIAQTRSAWLAIVGLSLLVLILLFICCKTTRIRLLKQLSLILLMTVAGCLLLLWAGKDSQFATSLKERFTGTAIVQEDSTQEIGSASDNVAERLKYWKKTTRMIADNPILGVGRANWKLNVGKYGYADVRTWSSGNVVPDFPHNVYLYIAAESGLPGLILFLVFWAAIAVAGIKTVRQTADETVKAKTIFLLGGFMAFAIDAFFSFPDTRAEHMFCLLLMGGFLLANYRAAVPETASPAGRSLKIPIVIAALLVIVFNGITGLKKMQYETHYNLAKANEANNNWNGILEEAAEAKSDWVNLSPKTMPVENLEIVAYKGLKKYPEAIRAAGQALRYNPFLAAAYNNLGTVYQESGQPDSAYKNYEKALRIAPDFAVPKKNMIIIAFSKKTYDTCLILFKSVNVNSDSIFIKVMQNIVFEKYQQKHFQQCIDIISGNSLSKQYWFDSVYANSSKMLLKTPVK